jgi:hypothetical protein
MAKRQRTTFETSKAVDSLEKCVEQVFCDVGLERADLAENSPPYSPSGGGRKLVANDALRSTSMA